MTTRQSLKQTNRLYHYVARVTRVYDGDTITVDLDLGLGVWRREQTIRLWKVNTPELRGADRPRGLAARDFLRDLILDETILLRTILDKRGDDRTGKFGRLLGELLKEETDGTLTNINQRLLDQGHALPMGADGRTIHPAAAPRREGDETLLPATVACPFCGQERRVSELAVVATCPNCLDGPFALRG